MHTILPGQSCVPGRECPRSARNSDEDELCPGEKFLQNSSNSIVLNELKGSQSSLSGTTSEGDLAGKIDESDAVLKLVNHILMEEELDNKISISQNDLALQAYEKSLYDAIGQNYPPSTYKPSDDKNPVSNTTCQSNSDSLKAGTTLPYSDDDFSWVQADNHILRQCSHSDFRPPCSGCDSVYGPCDSSMNVLPVSGLLSWCDSSVNKCRRGLEEASQTQTGNKQMINDLQNEVSLPPAPNEDTLNTISMIEKVGTEISSNGSRGRKNHQREGIGYTEEERSSKHSAVYLGETQLSDMFDKVLLSDEGSSEDEVSKKKGKGGKLRTRKSKSQKDDKQEDHTMERVHLTNLLTQCAEALASYDMKTASELLENIRQHSSPFGDASQKLVHCFANGLEARLAGVKGQMYPGKLSHTISGTPASDVLKVYQVYISFCPFLRASYLLANRTVSSLSRKETSLHIIDFGILYGFQWPVLFQSLSKRPGGPPKVRITGIELPSAGFRPFEVVKDTGRRLAHYCRRFNIPFEYFPITKNWETIRPQDFNIDEDEFVVVNCMYRLEHLLDESVIASSPRSAVVELIRSINPNIFIHGVLNANYNSPFFLTRFREALFHFSALFDMLEACLPREDKTRIFFETVIYGNDAINMLACEGRERFNRPETCKQWRIQLEKAGFRQISLNQDLLKEIRTKVKVNYHKDFMVEYEGHWMRLGWKGRTLHGVSCWKPL